MWENYIIDLCGQPNWPENLKVQPEEDVDAEENGPYILQSEGEKAIKEMRDEKATGDDNVPGDVFKLLGEDGRRIMTQLTSIYETGDWPMNST